MAKKPAPKDNPRKVASPLPPYVGVHPMADVINDEESIRELSAVGVCSVDGIPGQFCTFVVTFRGDTVLSVELSQPDFKVGALNRAKSEFVAAFLTNKPI